MTKFIKNYPNFMTEYTVNYPNFRQNDRKKCVFLSFKLEEKA